MTIRLADKQYQGFPLPERQLEVLREAKRRLFVS